MNAYWQIVRAIFRRIGVFAGLLLGIPLAVRLVGVYEPNPVATMLALAIGIPSVMWFIGGLLGSAVANLLGGTRATLIPAYRRRVLTVSVLLGMFLWSLAPLYYTAGGFLTNQIPWLRWVPLWSYGLMGLGFIGGSLSPDLGTGERAFTWSRESWVRHVLVMTLWLTPTLIAFSPSLRNRLNVPIDDALPGFTAMAMLCLLLGPLSWPTIVRLLVKLQSDNSPVKRSAVERLRSGDNTAWGLSALAGYTHSKGRLRIEFLVFQPAFLSMVTAPLAFAALFIGFQALWAGLGPTGMEFESVFKINANSVLIGIFIIPLTPIFGGAMDLPRLGRSLLLPGPFKRQNLPGQLFKRLLTIWMGGVMVGMFPVVVIALRMGTDPGTLAWFFLLVAWGICMAAAVEFFRAPSTRKKATFDPVRMVMSMVLLLVFTLTKPFFFDVYSAWVCLAVVAIAFVIPVVLYHLSLKRWTGMEYGA